MNDNNKRSQYRYKNKNRNKNRNRVSKRDKRKGSQNQSIQATIKIKLKQVFLPYLGLSLLTILLFGALRWLLDIYLDILPLKESYWNFVIPWFLSVLVVTIWMWPRYDILTLKWFKRSSSGYFFIAMVLALVIPLLISQNYLSKAAYKVIEVASLNDIRHYPKQKYFRVDDFEPLKSERIAYIETRVTNRRYFDSTLHIGYYTVTPFIAAENIWLGSSYHTSYDNRKEQSIKDRQYSAFINESRHKYAAEDFSHTNYFRKLKSSDSRNAYLQTIATANRQSTVPPLILEPEIGLFTDSLDRDFVWGFGSFFTGMGVCLLLILAADIDNQKNKNTRKHITRKKRKRVKKRVSVSDVSRRLLAWLKSNKT